MGLAPGHDLGQLLPVIHLFKRQLLHRRPGDDKPVVPLLPQLGEGPVKVEEVLRRGVPGLMAGNLHQLDIHLEGGVAQQPQQLGFCLDFFWHQVQDSNPQRTDVLPGGPVLPHNKDVLLLQHRYRRQGVGYPDGHGLPSSK